MTAHVTIALDEAQKAALDTIAETRQESVEALVSEAVCELIEYDRYFRAAVEKGLQDVREGRTFSHVEVIARARARRQARQDLSKA